ncbi:MucBP domain-containing protein [Streptococcus iners]|uniref:MucBP domain-containing protein n=1 Tax=Streptococcus iners TaxID=3028084 RepID=UPI002005560E|nr:YSIRK-type signal peptide-containing protein [Streptococcus suis]
MQKAKKKSFDWYGMKQHFSIRKYHFGAASVLLGMSLAMGAGAQTAKAETTAASSETTTATTTLVSSTEASAEVAPSTTTETSATVASTEASATVASTATETSATEAATTTEPSTEVATATERTATINYIVKYVLEDGTLVNAVVKSTTVTTTDASAKTTVEVVAELPAGYELANGQASTVSQEVTEGAENLVAVKVVKKATATTSTTQAPATTSTTTKTAAAQTPVAEAKVVLEQNISEAEVLSDEADRLVATSDSDNTALKTAANATKLAASEATKVLKDSVTTLENVNEQINAVRTNVEALALELRKFLGTEDIQVSLEVAAGASIGSGTGVLVEAQSTKPSMDDPNGASVASKTDGTMTGTKVANYYTFHYAALSSWYDAVRPGFYPYGFTPDKKPTPDETKANPLKYGRTDSAYFRASATADPATSPILVELVTKDGTVLESNYLNVGESANFTTFQATSGVDLPIVVSFVGETKTDSTAGTLSFQFDNNTVQSNVLVPRLVEHPTYYSVKDSGKDLATYTMVSQPGLVNTPSGVREIPGYKFVETTTTTKSYPKYAATSYVDQTREPFGSPIGSKLVATPVDKDGTVTKDLYLIDPTSTATPSYTLLSSDGFMKLMESSVIAPGATNTNLVLNPELLTKFKVMQIPANTIGNLADDAVNTGTVVTDPAQFTLANGNIFEILMNPNAKEGELYVFRVRALDAAGSRLQTHWIRKANSGERVVVPQKLEEIKIKDWDRVLQGQAGDANVTPYTAADGKTYYPILDEFGNPQGIQLTYAGYFQNYTLGNSPGTVTDTITTHWYTPVPQEAIIRYQVQGATDFLEDSGTLTGNPGTDITYSTEDTINKYKKLGYDLVSDNFTTKAGQDYDYDETVKQEFLVVIKPRIVDIPKTAVPGEPVDPTDPNSPVWPDTLKNLEATQEVTRTVEYKYEDGTPVLVDAAGNVLPKGSTEGTPLVKTETVTFTRPAQVNLVTGEITYGDWVADTTDTLKGNVLPEVSGYTASRTTLEGADAPMTETVKDKTVTATDADINEVVYYKENPKYGDVVVNYVNTDGKVIASPVVDTNDALVGTEYSTADRVPEKIVEDGTGDVYYYKEIKPEDAAKETGTVVEGTTEVTYVYEKAGNVVVNYTLADGTVIKAPVNDETNQKPGSPYDTKDNKPETITTTDGKVYKLVPTATKGNETGDVEAGKTLEVTYIYEEVKSDVVVEYYNTAGEVIAATVVDEDDKSVGTVYNTDEDNRPETITTADGTVYYYKEVKDTSAPTTGKVAETTTTVQYVFEQAGNVVVNYKLEDGTVIKAPVNDETNAKPGTEYNTTDNKPTTITTEDGKTYELIPTATIGNETGNVEAGKTTEVTYVYKEVKGNVIVNYVDENGNPISGVTDAGKETASTVEDTPETSTGTKYDTTDLRPNTITTADGKIYKLVPSAIPSNETGTVTPGTTEVTYVYELVQGDVIVHYEDKEGNKIAADVTDTQISDTGTPYDTTDNKPEKIVNATTGEVYYILPKDEVKAGSASETGKVVEGTTEVTYVYEPAGSVTVNYVTTDGTVIKSPVKDEENAEPGKTYSTEDNKPETITTEDGKTYKLVPNATKGEENGTVTSGEDKQVTYVYEEVKGNVVVEYYNTAGEKIAEDVEDTPASSTGTAYTTLDNKPAKITAADGTVYYYKEVKADSAAETGDVVEGTTTVKYVYEPAGSVTVNYVTTDGTVIKSPVKDEENAEPGKTYSTEDNKPETITTEDGKTYKLVPNATTGEENGTITSGEDKQVTYVYEEVKGSVVVNYIDTEGNVIKAPVTDTPSSSTGTAYDTTDNKPTTITTEDGTTYELVPVLTKGSETGKVVEGETVVTYVYRKVVAPTPDVKTGSVVIRYVEAGNESNVLKDPVLDENAVVTGTKYDTTDEGDKPAEIVKDGVRYVLVPSKTTAVDPNGNPVTETGEVAEGTTVVTYKYQKVANWIPQIPATPENPTPVNPVIPYPFDPTNPDKPIDPTRPYPGGEVPSIPHVPGFTPVDPKTNEPLKPVDPTDPSKGYVPPTPDESGIDTPIPYVQNGNVVVNYVTEDGTVIKAPVQDETNAPAGKSYDTTDNKPTEIVTEDGSRYVLIPSKTVGSETGTVEGGKTTEITYVYKKVANWIPQIPATPENPTPVNPVIPYPFDPTNPDKPIDPTTPYPDGEVPSIPHVPGFTPVDPKTNEPLKPVDPTDPSKGYVPPTPDESGIDTPIPYVQNGNVVVNYVTEDGTVIKAPVQDETNAPAGKSYDTTDNKPNTITTEDGTTYELVRVEGSETGTVEGGKTTEVTYVYRKVETPAKKVVTNHVDEDGNPIAPQEEGTTPNKSIPGYEFTGKTVTDPDGNTTHIYRKVETPAKKVVTNHVDEDGNPIAPQEEGTTPNKSIPGYEFTGKTVTDPDGNTTHIYRKVETPAKKVVTNHVDEDGNPIAPQEEGTTPNKSIPGYEFTGKTVTDPDGNTTHIYRKVTKVVTNHVDEDGNPIAPQEEGTTPNKSIPGYEFTGKTYTDGDGNTYHVYRKVSNPVAPKPETPASPAPQAPATPKPQAPAAPATPSAPATTAKAGAAQLPNTGEASSSAAVLGAGMLIAALALAGKRRRNED